MFEQLTERLARVFKNITGQGVLTDENMQNFLRQVQISLLEADVALPVVKAFIEQVRIAAKDKIVANNLKPEQELLKIVNDELVAIMGQANVGFNFKSQPPVVGLLVGLQGSGKTTTAAKLAKYLGEVDKKKVMLVSVDVYRPAAIEQLKVLAKEIDIAFFPSEANQKPLDIIKKAQDAAKKQFMDVLLVDTAGRLHVDDLMMKEVKALHKALNPAETLFVIDSMTGQDAVNTAKAFHEALSLTGIILTKTDGDARGGAALSVRHVTGQPIKFIGTGEKMHAFEAFHPERIASRMLGMGDMLSLIEEVERKTDEKTNQKLKNKIKKGSGFDFNDFRAQLLQMRSMGGLTSMVQRLPGMHKMSQAAGSVNDDALIRTLALIDSMTPKERRLPKIIIGSRKRRIAHGSGMQIQDVNKLLKQFEQMQKMMLKVSKPGGMKKLMRGMGGLSGMSGMLPPDMM
jgi:signal recognition particle subunit SRP54